MKKRILVALGLALLVAGAHAEGIKWGNDYKAALKQAKSTGKPVMLDFYTDW